MKFEKKQTTQEWLPFENIYDNGIIQHKNSFIKILKISPINYDLKSNLEKESILNSYKNFLKSCDFDIQILIQSKKEDISKTISQIKSVEEKNEKIKEIREYYVEYITKINEEKNSSSKNFYMVIGRKVDISGKSAEDLNNEVSKSNEYLNECYFKIKDSLTRCGNLVSEINSKKDIMDVFRSFMK